MCLQGVAGKWRGLISGFPLNGQSGCPPQTRRRHQEGGVLSNSSGQGMGARVDQGLWSQLRVETVPAGSLPSWGFGEEAGLPLHWG